VIAGGTNYVVINRGIVWYTSDLAGSWTSVDVAGQSITSVSDLAFGSGHFVAIIDGRIYRSNPVDGAFPPQIFKQPESFAATVGGTATFTVGAQGAEPITYQWRMNGTDIAGATNSSLTLTNVSIASAGEYDVIVTNPAGTVTSAKAELSINFADVHTYAGVTLRGAVGDKFLIETRDKNNDPWTTVTNITLSQSTFIWIDYDSPDQKKGLFRVTYQGR
jgi:hypothetical protein